jgi:hypothetical protein
VVLVVNDHYLKGACVFVPAVTGKPSDVAGLQSRNLYAASRVFDCQPAAGST